LPKANADRDDAIDATDREQESEEESITLALRPSAVICSTTMRGAGDSACSVDTSVELGSAAGTSAGLDVALLRPERRRVTLPPSPTHAQRIKGPGEGPPPGAANVDRASLRLAPVAAATAHTEAHDAGAAPAPAPTQAHRDPALESAQYTAIAYVRSASGDCTDTTSPLIHVHEAVSCALTFVAPVRPSEKDAVPPLAADVAACDRPSSVEDVARPAPSTAESTDTEHGAGADTTAAPDEPSTSCNTTGCAARKDSFAVLASV
jgi:hypothetical protein